MKKSISQMHILILHLFNWLNKHRCTRLVHGSRALNFRSLKTILSMYSSKTSLCPAAATRENWEGVERGMEWNGHFRSGILWLRDCSDGPRSIHFERVYFPLQVTTSEVIDLRISFTSFLSK